MNKKLAPTVDWEVTGSSDESRGVTYTGLREEKLYTASFGISVGNVKLDDFIQKYNKDGIIGGQQVSSIYQSEKYDLNGIVATKLTGSTELGLPVHFPQLIMLIDTHCHLAFKAFDDSWPEVVKRAREKDIQMIAVGAAKATSEKSIAIAESSDGVFAALGVHPTHTDEEFDFDWFNKAADHPKVVAIGETGIDHFHIDENQREVILKKQEDLLRAHLTIARDKKLPVILHSRDSKTESKAPPPNPLLVTGGGMVSEEIPIPARQRGLGGGLTAYEHLYNIIKDFGYFKCVLHCYGGDWAMAKKFLDLGLMLSFTGIVTFKNASETLKEVVRNIPMDRMMIETDSPYLAPEPYRGKQNEPSYVEYVARGIAFIRGQDYDTVASQTTENARRFFGI
ncbi:MAG: TatD family hydrolase [Parcubacteria group bacterium]|nr:TatD family hydrolase [Parcubacteria group bacterium]